MKNKLYLIVFVLFAASIIGAIINTQEFLRAYLIGYLFAFSFPLGSLGWLMLQYLTGGEWGVFIRSVLEASVKTIPFFAILFLPIIIGSAELYPWIQKNWTNYFNPSFTLGRTIFYFLIWIVLSKLLTRRGLKDYRIVSGPGLLLFFFVTTFAAIDWIMSLDAEWSSTIYGLIIIAGQAICSLSFCIIMLARKTLRTSDPKIPILFHDLGKLLLATLMLWGYFVFSQYLIIWSGNLPDEISWILARIRGGWEAVGLFVVLFHFAIPFGLLLSAQLKKRPKQLARVAVLLIIVRLVDSIWYIEPAFDPGTFYINWMTILLPLLFSGIFILLFQKYYRNEYA